MTAPVRLDVFSDYLCPWCYNAAVRLREIQQAYGDRVRVHWRTFPLIPGEQPDRRVTQKTRDGWQRIGAEEPRACFAPPEVDAPLPSSSIPALTAAPNGRLKPRSSGFTRGSSPRSSTTTSTSPAPTCS